MYLHFKFGASAPPELLRLQIAEHFGWTLEYVDNLGVADLHECVQYLDAKHKARK